MLKRPRIGRARWRAGAVVLGCLWAAAGLAAWASQPAEVQTVFKTAPAPDRSPAFVLAKAELRPAPVPHKQGTSSTSVKRVLIEGNQRVDQATILSKLAIRPGQVMTGPILEAALKRLYDTGQFATFDVKTPTRGGSGDLVLRVTENPLINKMAFEGNTNFTDFRLRSVMLLGPDDALSGMKMHSDADAIVQLYREAGWPDAKVTFKVLALAHARVDVKLIVHEGAKGGPGDLPTGLIKISANRMDPEEGRHRLIYTGNVVAIQRGRRVMSDLLVITSRAPDEPGGPGLKEAMWEGNVRVDFGDFGDQAATADRAVYDGQAKTMTLSGNVVVQRGPWAVKNDRLVVDMKDQ
jgi:lipopolysaccharide export system protein LptA